MSYSLSVWLDDKTAEALSMLCDAEDRKRGDMVRVLIKKAAINRNLISKNQSKFMVDQQNETKSIHTT
jgi:predicted transcriptional regulator